MTYTWLTKRSKKVHQVNPRTDRSYCWIENSAFGIDEDMRKNRSETAPAGRALCRVCIMIEARKRA